MQTLTRSVVAQFRACRGVGVIKRHSTLAEVRREPSLAGQLAFTKHMLNVGLTPVFSEKPSLLKGVLDRYGGVKVQVGEEVDQLTKAKHFLAILKDSLQQWRREGKRGIWLEIPKTHGHLVGAATQLGFDFHHAQPGYVMLTNWLPVGEENKIPAYASHYVGVGGFVVNERREVLAVKEKYRDADYWKLPGGLSTVGEGIKETAIREVFEETGVRTEFHRIIAVREKHGYSFGRDDLYFVALLRALTTNITACPTEIQMCSWIPVEEYIANEQVCPINKHIAVCAMNHLENSLAGRSQTGFSNMDVLAYDLTTHNTVYSAGNEIAKTYLQQQPYVKNSNLQYYKETPKGTTSCPSEGAQEAAMVDEELQAIAMPS